MRKSLLAVAALMGVAVLPQRAEAVAFRVAEDITGNMGFRAQIWGQYLGERRSGFKSATDFRLNNVRLYANGNVGKHMFFGANLDFFPLVSTTRRTVVTEVRPRTGVVGGQTVVTGVDVRADNIDIPSATEVSRVTDAFIGLRFKDELRVQAGLFRTPFSRAALTDSYTFLVPTGYFYGALPVDRGFGGTRGATDYRNAGLAIWGEVGGKDVPFKYYLGVFDGPYNNSTGALGKDNLMYAFRVQYTPTMLGFKGERGYGLRDTQLGRQNVFSFGVGYATQKCGDTSAGACNPGGGNLSFTTTALTFDVKHEQKFGKTLIAGWEAAYFDVKDINTAKDDRKGYYLQVHGINDQVVGIGKPGLAIKYEYSEEKRQATGAKTKFTRIGGAVNYFLKGQDALVQLAVDSVNRPAGQKDYTDITLAFQVQF